MTSPSNTEANQTSHSVDLGSSKVNALANAELQTTVAEIIWRTKPGALNANESAAQILAIFQAREQQLLTELLGEAVSVDCFDTESQSVEATMAVPVSVIERLQNKTNDGDSDGGL